MSNIDDRYSRKIAVHDYYEDPQGRIYKIRNVEYPHNRKPGYFGKFIIATKDDQIDSFSEEPTGMIIYQDEQNPNIGYRIYRGIFWGARTFYFNDGCLDAGIIEELQKRQATVKLTEFPTGVVTVCKQVIGQEMPFYPNAYTLKEFATKIKDNPNKIRLLTNSYISIFKSFQELIDNEIFYGDLHTSNIMVNKDDSSITNIIDFSSIYTEFGKLYSSRLETYQTDFANIVNVANEFAGIDYELEKLHSDKPVEEAIEKVLKMEYKLR